MEDDTSVDAVDPPEIRNARVTDGNGITIYQIDTAAQKDAYWNYYQGLGLAPSRWIAFLNDYAG